VVEYRLCLEIDRKIAPFGQDKTMVNIARTRSLKMRFRASLTRSRSSACYELDKRVEGSSKVLRSNAHQTT